MGVRTTEEGSSEEVGKNFSSSTDFLYDFIKEATTTAVTAEKTSSTLTAAVHSAILTLFWHLVNVVWLGFFRGFETYELSCVPVATFHSKSELLISCDFPLILFEKRAEELLNVNNKKYLNPPNNKNCIGQTGNSWILRCLRFCEFWWFLNWLGFPIKIVWSSICFTTSRSSNDVLLLTKETLRKALILLMRKGSVEITRFSAWYFEDFHYFLANQAKSIIQNNRNFLFFKTREKKSCSRRRTKFA